MLKPESEAKQKKKSQTTKEYYVRHHLSTTVPFHLCSEVLTAASSFMVKPKKFLKSNKVI